MQQYFNDHPVVLFGVIVLVIWSAVWKAVALWKAARAGDKAWFAALFVINTAGILEILYIFVFTHKGQQRSAASL